METAESTEGLSLLLVEMAVILVAAKLAGHTSVKLGQPAILGELLAGVLLGTMSQFLLPGELYGLLISSTSSDSHLAILGELGILLLLFRVGLESQPRDLLEVGGTSLLVATAGVLLPLGLGIGVCSLFANDYTPISEPWQMHLFVGATMAATSVGVTANVLTEMNRLHSRESRIILGAAVVDDILGLMLLAIVGGVVVNSGNLGEAGLGKIVATIGLSALAFTVIGTLVGLWIARHYLTALKTINGAGAYGIGLFVFCIVFAATAEFAGLAPLIGAFLAGLVVDDAQDNNLDVSAATAESQLAPLTAILAPIFFVLMGMQVELGSILNPSIGLYILAIVATAFMGKFVVGFLVPGPISSKGFVGAGMIPRGEVGLIFAAVGRTTGIIGEQTFSALVLMVIVTTLAAPPLLKYFERGLKS